jgi:excisionase family DNA binding protein
MMTMQTDADPWAAVAGRLFATVPEAAAILRYDVRTVRRGIAAGEIPATKAGSTYRVPVSWLRKQAGEATGEEEDQLRRT